MIVLKIIFWIVLSATAGFAFILIGYAAAIVIVLLEVFRFLYNLVFKKKRIKAAALYFGELEDRDMCFQ